MNIQVFKLKYLLDREFPRTAEEQMNLAEKRLLSGKTGSMFSKNRLNRLYENKKYVASLKEKKELTANIERLKRQLSEIKDDRLKKIYEAEVKLLEEEVKAIDGQRKSTSKIKTKINGLQNKIKKGVR